MQFKNVIGQERIKSQLKQFVISDRLPHALLIAESEGRGALGLALSIAGFTFCKQRNNEERCGECSDCKKVDQLIHPDLHFAFPVVKKGDKLRKECFSDDYINIWRNSIRRDIYLTYQDWLLEMNAENSQGDINKKECNEIIRKLSLKSFSSGKKFLIMWLPEFLGLNGNRLLKLVEEPPDNSYIIFVSHRIDSVLPTLLSRFQIIQLPPVEDKQIREFLLLQNLCSLDEANAISLQSNGNIVLAKNLTEKKESQWPAILLDWLRISYKSDPEALTDWVNQYAGFPKEDQKQFLSYSLHVIRELIKHKFVSNYIPRLSNNELELLSTIENTLSVDKAEAILHLLSDSLYGLERNMNSKIIMMADSFKIGEIMRSNNLKMNSVKR